MSYLYIIRSGKKGAYKIGIANNPDNRMKDLQVGNPELLYLIAKINFGTKRKAYLAEQKLHRIFKKYRIRGEWFSKKIQLSRADGYFKTNLTEQKEKHEENELNDEINENLDLELLNSMPEL